MDSMREKEGPLHAFLEANTPNAMATAKANAELESVRRALLQMQGFPPHILQRIKRARIQVYDAAPDPGLPFIPGRILKRRSFC